MLSSLADLFHQLSVKRRKAPVKPNKFVNMLKKENEAFDNVLQHDAQEFLNFLLNHIGDTLKEEISKQEQESSFSDSSNCDHHETWVHELFQVFIQIFLIITICKIKSTFDRKSKGLKGMSKMLIFIII